LGDTVPVFVYTNGDCAELFLNGRSLGRRCKDPKSRESVDRFRLQWRDVIYEPGELKVVAYREGRVLGEKTLRTTGEPARLQLTADRNRIAADGMDLSYLLIECYDALGNLHPLADDEVNIEIAGPGSIAGVGNGNPQSFAPFQAEVVNLFYGKAMVIIKSREQAGTIRVRVTAEGLLGDEVEVRSE
jgi:beta-galactosidase